jgi:hypothetical protein
VIQPFKKPAYVHGDVLNGILFLFLMGLYPFIYAGICLGPIIGLGWLYGKAEWLGKKKIKK